MRALSLIVILPLTVACYRYGGIEVPAPDSGTQVSAELTGAGSAELANQLGPNVTTVRGQVLESMGDTLLLALSAVTGRNQQETFWKGEQVRIPLAAVARVQQRRFSLGRSLLLGGAALGAMVVAGKAFEGNGSAVGGAPGGSNPPPQ